MIVSLLALQGEASEHAPRHDLLVMIDKPCQFGAGMCAALARLHPFDHQTWCVLSCHTRIWGIANVTPASLHRAFPTQVVLHECSVQGLAKEVTLLEPDEPALMLESAPYYLDGASR